MLHQSFGGAVIFLSLEHFIAPALIKNIHLLMKKYVILDIILGENVFLHCGSSSLKIPPCLPIASYLLSSACLQGQVHFVLLFSFWQHTWYVILDIFWGKNTYKILALVQWKRPNSTLVDKTYFKLVSNQFGVSIGPFIASYWFLGLLKVIAPQNCC